MVNLYVFLFVCNFQVYYSEETDILFVEAIEGKCEVRKKNDLPACSSPVIFHDVFFCDRIYDPSKGSLKQVIPFCFLCCSACWE